MKFVRCLVWSLAKLSLAILIAVSTISFGVHSPAYAACANVSCGGNIDFTHIKDRHCTGSCTTDNKSILNAAHCASNDTLRNLCRSIQANGVETLQPNGRYQCVATLTANVNGTTNVGQDRNNSCNATTTGTVIYGTGTSFPGSYVVTMFPGS